MAAGRWIRLPSTRQSVTSRSANYSRRIAALLRWHVNLVGVVEMLVVNNRIIVELPPGSRAAVRLPHAHPTTSRGAAATVLPRIAQRRLLLLLLLPLRQQKPLPRHRRPLRTC